MVSVRIDTMGAIVLKEASATLHVTKSFKRLPNADVDDLRMLLVIRTSLQLPKYQYLRRRRLGCQSCGWMEEGGREGVRCDGTHPAQAIAA